MDDNTGALSRPGTVEEVSHVIFDLAYRVSSLIIGTLCLSDRFLAQLKATWEDKILHSGSSTHVIDILGGLHMLT